MKMDRTEQDFLKRVYKIAEFQENKDPIGGRMKKLILLLTAIALLPTLLILLSIISLDEKSKWL